MIQSKYVKCILPTTEVNSVVWIVKCSKPLTIFTGASVFNIWQGSEYVSAALFIYLFIYFLWNVLLGIDTIGEWD